MTPPAINARVASFVADLEGLVRKAALEAVQAALGGGAPARSAPSSARAPSAKAKPATASPAKPAPASTLPRVKKGTRRSPEDVARAVRAIKEFLTANPGSGAEQIAKGLGIASKELALPISNLLGAKSITKKGERRATRYFVAGASEGKIAAEAPKAVAPAQKAAEKTAKGKKAGKGSKK